MNNHGWQAGNGRGERGVHISSLLTIASNNTSFVCDNHTAATADSTTRDNGKTASVILLKHIDKDTDSDN